MKQITSKNNPLIMDIVNLNDKKYRQEKKEFILEGYHLVKEAYLEKRLRLVLSSDEALLKEFDNIDSYLVTDEIIKKISNTLNPQKIIGIASIIDYKITKDMKKIVLLDDVSDPGNMGTIIRSAAALGYDAVISSLNSVDYYNDKVIRSTQGSIFKIACIKDELPKVIDELKKLSFHIYGTSLNTNKFLEDIIKQDKYVVVFGNEAHGVSNDILNKCDELFKIDMKNNVESLNVAASSAIILYELNK